MGQWPLLLAGLLVTEQNTEPQSLSRTRHVSDPGTRASHVTRVSVVTNYSNYLTNYSNYLKSKVRKAQYLEFGHFLSTEYTIQ